MKNKHRLKILADNWDKSVEMAVKLARAVEPSLTEEEYPNFGVLYPRGRHVHVSFHREPFVLSEGIGMNIPLKWLVKALYPPDYPVLDKTTEEWEKALKSLT